MDSEKLTKEKRAAIAEYVKEKVDIVDYIEQFVELKQDGKEFAGKSPFKDGEDCTPSMKVSRENKVFYDFSVSSVDGGTVIDFVMAYNKCGIDDALNILLAYLGEGEVEIDIPQKLSATIVAREHNPKIETEKPTKAKPLPDDYMERYEKRDDKLDIWREEGISSESLDKFQVYYDPIDDRLVYPIRSVDGKIVNVGGRTLAPDYKERGYKKYCYYFKWGSMNTIYGFWENLPGIKRRSEIILFEGCKSVLIADSWGLHNTGAILTSHLNQNQMGILIKLGVDVVFALDKEVDVRQDAHIQRLKRYVNVYYLYDREGLLDEKDSPVDKGKAVFKKLYMTAIKLR